LIELARRSGQIKTLAAYVVHEKDKFSWKVGQRPEHEPYLGDDDPGELRLCWAIAEFTDEAFQVEVMTKRQIEAVRKCSRAGDSGPWTQHTEEMWRKTCIKRLAKYLPLTIELADAIEADNAVEIGTDILQMPLNAADAQEVQKDLSELAAVESRAEALTEKIRRGPGRPPKAQEPEPIPETKPTPEETKQIEELQLSSPDAHQEPKAESALPPEEPIDQTTLTSIEKLKIMSEEAGYNIEELEAGLRKMKLIASADDITHLRQITAQILVKQPRAFKELCDVIKKIKE